MIDHSHPVCGGTFFVTHRGL